MHKKFITLSLVLILFGATVLGWTFAEKRIEQQKVDRSENKCTIETDDYIKQYHEWLQLPPEERTQLPLVFDKYGNTKTKAQLLQEQQERLEADLDKLAADEIDVYPFADVLYGENWQNELKNYKKQKERNEIALTSSIVCTSMGGLYFVWCLFLWIARRVIKDMSGLRKYFVNVRKSLKQAKDKKSGITDTKEIELQKSSKQQSPSRGHSKVLTKSAWQKSEPIKFKSKVENKNTPKQKTSDSPENIAVLLSDEKSVEPVIPQNTGKMCLDTSEHSKPLDNTLKELTQQVSAIRQYTTYQQDRLEKLQDGYDWNIIRTFCLRVIRCIDNLENRISQLNKQDSKATYLEEVKDELIFALESSGIEQFEPEINSAYRGQEKYAEAIKNKESCNDQKRTGKIARVIRPGYQYFINDENIKVVRPAQVKLFA